MWDWLRGSMPILADLLQFAASIRDALIRLANTLLSLIKGWVAWASLWAQRYWVFLNRLWYWAVSIVDLIQHIIFTIIPARIADAANNLTRWVGQLVKALHDTVSGWISTVVNWVRGELGNIRNTITGWVRAIRAWVGGLVNRLVAVERRVVALLTHPQALADWLAGAIVAAVWRWIHANAVWVGRFLLSRAIPGTRALAGILEQLFVDLFF